MLSAAAAATGCGGNVTVEEDASLCLTWPDGGGPQATDPPAGLACDSIPGAGVLGDDSPFIEYVCVAPDEGGCPSPSAAHARFAACVEERTGPACQPNPDGTFTQGKCSGRATASVCGPDPAAAGACCYYATVVDFEYYT